ITSRLPVRRVTGTLRMGTRVHDASASWLRDLARRTDMDSRIRELTAQSQSRRPLMTMNLPDPPAYVVVLASGGLDSTTLAYHLRDTGAKARLLSFDYGQRHA